MAPINPYTVDVPEQQLERLKAKLDLADFPDELEDAGWDYGAPLADVKELAAYWKDEFDWRKQEAEINRLPNLQAKILVEGFDELNIHFLYQKSDNPNAIPLLFVHGCKKPFVTVRRNYGRLSDIKSGPGNFLEVVKLLPLLKEGRDGAPAFHIVAPSLPNFGFSDGVKKRGFALPQYAETCHKLMLQLGYDQYGKRKRIIDYSVRSNNLIVTQGGDWGSHITRVMGYLYPNHVKGQLHQPICPHHPILTPAITKHPT